MARITLPGFSRGIYAVGPLIFEDGVAEYEGEVPLVVERLAYALGASIDDGAVPATDPGLEPHDEPEVESEPTPAEVWGVGEKAAGGDVPADSTVEEAPEIDYSAPTGGRSDLEPEPISEPVVDAGNGTPVPGDSEPGDVEPGASSDLGTADSGSASPVVDEQPADEAPASDAAPVEPDEPVEVTDPSVPAADDTAAAPAAEVPSADDSASGKHAADVEPDVDPVTPDATPAADTTTDASTSGA